MRRLILPLLLLSACAPFPEVDRAERLLGDGPAPILLPTQDLLARVDAPSRVGDAQATLAARAAALRARAAALRATPVG
ncbi:MAG: hypothetical protein ACT4OK_11835 [Gemmobacter sp.]